MYVGQSSQLLKNWVIQHRCDCRVKVNVCGPAQRYHTTKHKMGFNKIKIFERECSLKSE